MSFELERIDIEKDREFSEIMHGKDAAKERGLLSSFRKDKEAQKIALDSYFGFWGDKCTSEKNDIHQQERFKFYATLTRHYYNLVERYFFIEILLKKVRLLIFMNMDGQHHFIFAVLQKTNHLARQLLVMSTILRYMLEYVKAKRYWMLDVG